jgi:hypothetical protein
VLTVCFLDGVVEELPVPRSALFAARFEVVTLPA